jgi:hypothetical protein
MVNFPKITHFHGKFTKKVFFSWKILSNGNIIMHGINDKNTRTFKEFFPHALDKT